MCYAIKLMCLFSWFVSWMGGEQRKNWGGDGYDTPLQVFSLLKILLKNLLLEALKGVNCSHTDQIPSV